MPAISDCDNARSREGHRVTYTSGGLKLLFEHGADTLGNVGGNGRQQLTDDAGLLPGQRARSVHGGVPSQCRPDMADPHFMEAVAETRAALLGSLERLCRR